MQASKAHSLKRASKNFTQRMRKMPEQAVLLQTHLIRYAPKAQDTWSVLPEVVKFKDPLTVDKGYPSSLGSSFVIEIPNTC